MESKESPHELDYFIRLANETCNEALDDLRDPIQMVAAIDDLYAEYIASAGKIKVPAAPLLLLNAHAIFRAAVRLALSGQLPTAFMALRGCIESALYAHAMIMKPDLQQVWLNRNQGAAARQACRNAFAIAKMFRELENDQGKVFADNLRDQYESTIDFGAHPNSHLVLRSTHIEKREDGTHSVDFAYIHGSGSLEMRQSLLACLEIGVMVFFVFLLCHREHPNVAELNQRAEEIHGHITAFIKNLGLTEATPGC